MVLLGYLKQILGLSDWMSSKQVRGEGCLRDAWMLNFTLSRLAWGHDLWQLYSGGLVDQFHYPDFRIDVVDSRLAVCICRSSGKCSRIFTGETKIFVQIKTVSIFLPARPSWRFSLYPVRSPSSCLASSCRTP